MDVPSFADLGKNARDIFKTGYHQGKGLIKLNVKTKSIKRFQMMSDVTLNYEASKLNGLMETKYKTNAAGGMLLKWTTEGVLSLGYEFNGLLMKGINLFSECSYNPETAAKGIKVSSKFANERINARCEISNGLDTGIGLLGSVVLRCWNLLLGYQAGYDANKVLKNDVGIVYGYSDIDMHFRCTCIPHVYGLSVSYKARPDLDIAANGIFAKGGDVQKWTVGAGAKYKIDEQSTLRFKFNSDLQLATSLLQKLNDGITLILSFNIDCANVTRGGHRVGLALNVEA